MSSDLKDTLGFDPVFDKLMQRVGEGQSPWSSYTNKHTKNLYIAWKPLFLQNSPVLFARGKNNDISLAFI